MSLNELSRNIRFDNASKGFDPTEGGVNRYILLAISELCEAQDQLRDGHSPTYIYYRSPDGKTIITTDKPNELEYKPEGFPIEVADAAIRLLDIAGKFEMDLEDMRVTPCDYGNVPLDDWLLGIVNTISDMFNSDAGLHDFQYNLQQALSTIRLMCDRQAIDLDYCIHMKLEFNRSRPPKHGRQF